MGEKKGHSERKTVRFQPSRGKTKTVHKKSRSYSENRRIGEHETRICADVFKRIRDEMSKVLVGQHSIVTALLRGLLCNGHILVEGVPGIAKTLSIRALGQVTGCETKRIQFTVDLLPTDILGLTTYTPGKGFEVTRGPIFANFVIADEINRSPPKTQSALLEAMQERQVTIGKETYALPTPFFVMATENPLEVSGVYILPEAQVDRFLFKILMGYPKPDEEQVVLRQNMTLRKFDEFELKAVTTPQRLVEMQEITKNIFVSVEVERYIVAIVDMSRNKAFEYAKYIEWGGSPRASIGLYIAAKAQALLNGRNFVIPDDVKEVAKDVLRHRIMLTYAAQAEGIDSDFVIDKILQRVPVP